MTMMVAHFTSKNMKNALAVVCIVIQLLCSAVLPARAWTLAGTDARAHTWRSKVCLHVAKDDVDDDLMAQANRLRQEAKDLEKMLDGRRNGSSSSSQQNAVNEPAKRQYTSLGDSEWTITYRFTGEPESDDESAERPDAFAGKIDIRLLSDGYTDLLSQESFSTGKPLEISKCWGWDLENSSEDDQDYVLLSMDAKLPNSKETKRFYLQARQTLDQNFIQFEEGTVTVKQDVVPSSANGFFGFLSPKGILAQFRQVGNFVAKPKAS